MSQFSEFVRNADTKLELCSPTCVTLWQELQNLCHKNEIQTSPMGITAVPLGSTAVPMCNAHHTSY